MHYIPVSARIRNALLNPAWVCFTWVGMTIGVSMFATPVKFAAETLTRPVALDVGRVTFLAFNKAELAALILLLIVIRVSGRSRDLWAWVSGLALILVAQGAWLIPELAARTDSILAGVEPPPSHAHTIYLGLELVKIGLLFVLGFRSLTRRP
jgi:hypothetical protein